MLVGERMISSGKRISASQPVTFVIETFEKSGLMWLPVVDSEEKLLGLITPACIKSAKKRLAEDNDNTGKELTARDFMTTKFISVTDKTPIEEAVRIMIDYNVSELPVVKDGFFIGVITQKILLRVLMEVTGARRQGLRLMVQLENNNGELLHLLELIRSEKGLVEGVCTYCASENEYLIVTMRVGGVDKYSLKNALQDHDFKVLDIR